LLTFISIPSLFVPEPCSSLPISTNCAYSRIAKSTDKGRKCCYVNIIHLPASWLLEHITRSEYTESCKFNVAWNGNKLLGKIELSTLYGKYRWKTVRN
jgi:hypothetical protein